MDNHLEIHIKGLHIVSLAHLLLNFSACVEALGTCMPQPVEYLVIFLILMFYQRVQNISVTMAASIKWNDTWQSMNSIPKLLTDYLPCTAGEEGSISWTFTSRQVPW